MSTSSPNQAFSAEFRAKWEEKTKNSWRCPTCMTYNKNDLKECRSCAKDDILSVKRDADDITGTNDKKPKVTGFVFNPIGNTPTTTIFNVPNQKPTGFTGNVAPVAFKFGVGNNSVTLNIPTAKVEKKKEEVIEREVDEEYRDDEKSEDIMKSRIAMSWEECVNAKHDSEAVKSFIPYVFGSGEMGQLGLGEDMTLTAKPIKHEKANILECSLLVCGSLFTIMVTSDKKSMYSWGDNDDNQLGRDGDETIPGKVLRGEIPKEDKIEQVAVGRCHVVVLTSSGRVFSWGTYTDRGGKLGWSKEIKVQKTPKEIKFSRGIKIQSICCGESHSLALSSKGEVYGWGSAEQGQLRVRLFESMKKNALIPRSLMFHEGRRRVHATRIWAGGFHSMVLLENGVLMSFGLNNKGQLGNCETSCNVELAERLFFFDEKKVVDAALSQHASAILCEDGCVYTCGTNSAGELGRKSKNEEYDAEFEKVPFPEDVKIRQIGCGYHHILAVDDHGLLYTWGFGENGQLGNGKVDDACEMLPYHVRSRELANKRVIMVAGGSQHSVLLTKEL